MSKKVILNENMFRRLVLDEYNLHKKRSIEDYLKAMEPYKQWYEEHYDSDGWIDYDKVTDECLELLKKTKDIISLDFPKIELENGCRIWLGDDAIKNQELDLWEIQLPGPGGQCFDGESLEDEDLDYEMQKELTYHLIWK